MADIETDDRTQQFEDIFQQQPRAQLPAEIQQVVMDERPRGAISVHVKRDLGEVLKQIKLIATAAGDDFFYSWPTKNKDGTKGVVEGPSVKCANAVARIYGNCSVKVRAFDQGSHWVLYAQFYDFETGFVYERPFQQRKGQNIGGKMDADRAADIVFQIGTSKAARNAVCNALSEFTDYAFAVAKEQLVAKIGKDLVKHRDRVVARLSELKVELARVEVVRGKVVASWLAADVAKTIAEIQAINDGMGHPEELWPMLEAGQARPQPEDFKPTADGQAGKPAETAKPGTPAAGQQGSAGSPASESPQTGSPPTASPGAQAGDSSTAAAPATSKTDVPAQAAPVNPQETAQAGPAEPAAEEPGPSTQADNEPPEGPTKAEAALEAAQAVLQRGIDNLQNLRTPEEIDQAAPSIVEVLAEIEDLDAEDLALLKNRWLTAQLERKREIGRKPKGKR